jgi:hypothetical protein
MRLALLAAVPSHASSERAADEAGPCSSSRAQGLVTA